MAERFGQLRDPLLALLIRQGVDLVEGCDTRFVGQFAAIGLQLADNGAIILGHRLGRAIDQMQQHGAALHMAKEHIAQPPAFMRAFDQTRNIGDDKFSIVHAHDAQIGVQRGKGIIRDLGPRIGRGGEKGRFARIGQTQQTGIGDQLQPQPQRALHARLTRIGAAWGLVGGGLEMQVAEAAIAAARQNDPLAHFGQVRDDGLFVFVKDLGADGNAQHHIGPIAPRALGALTGLAVLGKEMLLIAKVDQRVETVHGLSHHIAAIAAITPIGTAVFDELLPPERDAAPAAAAGTDIDLGQIEKFHRARPCW